MIALVPPGSDLWLTVIPVFPTSCCFTIESLWFSSDNPPSDRFTSMIISELVLVIASLTRGVELFCRGNDFASKWPRTKPGGFWKRFLDKHYLKNHSALIGVSTICFFPWDYGHHCMVLFVMARAVLIWWNHRFKKFVNEMFICQARTRCSQMLQILWLQLSHVWEWFLSEDSGDLVMDPNSACLFSLAH